MLIIMKLVLFIIILFVELSSAIYWPCNGKSQLGDECDLTTDCEHKGAICLRGRCRCHPHYVETVDEKGKNRRCQRLPAKIDEPCEGKCREPLFCRRGVCQCVQRGNTAVLNGECVFTSNLGDRCTRHYDCTTPFTACVNSQCVCISGTVQQGNKCVAAANCPFGGTPGPSCVRKAQYQETVENMVNSGSIADDCRTGYYCVTSSDSPIGHCCPTVCPLNSTPNSEYSCDPSAAPNKQCSSDTHYCHRVAGSGFAFGVCCRRPCSSLGPTALYIRGECVARGQLQSECGRHEQCDALQTMQCDRQQQQSDGSQQPKNLCMCQMGFSPLTDPLTNATRNPSQTCRRECTSNSLARDTLCLAKVGLQQQCFIQQQCPVNSGCYRGRCLCRCAFEQRNGSTCEKIPPPPTTTTSKSSLVVPVLPGLGGSENRFVDLITQLFSGGGGRNAPRSSANIGSFLGVGSSNR